MRNKLLLRIEEIILVFLILLNVFDFAEALSPEFDYVKKVVSFVLMFYLLYKVSLSKQFFGVKNVDFDFLVIFAMFVMVIVRNAVSIGKTAEPSFFTPFFNLIISNAQLFEITSFYVGTLLLLGLAVYSSFRIPIKTPSLLSVLHEDDTSPSWKKVFINYLLFLTFFLFFFNMFFEWLTIAIDAPLASIGLIAYLFLAWRKHHFNTESALFKVGNFGEKFIEGLVKHFKYKEYLLLGIVGMLILHLITDVGVFLIPVLTGLHDPLYEVAVQNNPTIWFLAKQSSSTYGGALLYLLQYLLATIGMLFLMIFPAFIWYSAYFKKKLYSTRLFLAIFYSTLTALIFTPIFSIIPLREEFYGVGINLAPKLINLGLSLSASLATFLVVFFLGRKLSKEFSVGIIVITSGFFAWYVINYFLSSVNYLVGATSFLILERYYFLSIHFFVFLMLTLIFYLVGFWLYLRTIIKKVTI